MWYVKNSMASNFDAVQRQNHKVHEKMAIVIKTSLKRLYFNVHIIIRVCTYWKMAVGGKKLFKFFLQSEKHREGPHLIFFVYLEVSGLSCSGHVIWETLCTKLRHNRIKIGLQSYT